MIGGAVRFQIAADGPEGSGRSFGFALGHGLQGRTDVRDELVVGCQDGAQLGVAVAAHGLGPSGQLGLHLTGAALVGCDRLC